MLKILERMNTMIDTNDSAYQQYLEDPCRKHIAGKVVAERLNKKGNYETIFFKDSVYYFYEEGGNGRLRIYEGCPWSFYVAANFERFCWEDFNAQKASRDIPEWVSQSLKLKETSDLYSDLRREFNKRLFEDEHRARGITFPKMVKLLKMTKSLMNDEIS